MKKDQRIAKRAMDGFARYGVTSVRFGNKVARLKGKKVVVEKYKKGAVSDTIKGSQTKPCDA